MFTHAGCAPGDRKGIAKAVVLHKLSNLAFPVLCQHWRDRITVAGISNRACEELIKRHRAEAFPELYPGIDRTRHRNTVPAVFRNAVLAGKIFGCPRRRRAAAAVKAVQAGGIPNDGKGVAADAVHGGFDNGQADRGGDGRVHGIAAATQDLKAGLGGERL